MSFSSNRKHYRTTLLVYKALDVHMVHTATRLGIHKSAKNFRAQGIMQASTRFLTSCHHNLAFDYTKCVVSKGGPDYATPESKLHSSCKRLEFDFFYEAALANINVS